jgi:hypothetical protein
VNPAGHEKGYDCDTCGDTGFVGNPLTEEAAPCPDCRDHFGRRVLGIQNTGRSAQSSEILDSLRLLAERADEIATEHRALDDETLRYMCALRTVVKTHGLRGWRCYWCGTVCETEAAASAHFGAPKDGPLSPACVQKTILENERLRWIIDQGQRK